MFYGKFMDFPIMPSRTRFSMTITMVHGKRPNRGQERGSQGGPNDFLLDACGCATPLGRMEFFFTGEIMGRFNHHQKW